jgi:hypothetical protein
MKVVSVRNPATSMVAVLSLIVLLRYAQDLCTPIILSVLIAYAANPLVAAIQSIRIPRALAALLVVSSLVFGIGLGGYVLRNQANTVLQTLPEGAAKVRRKIEELRGGPAQTTNAITSIQETAREIEKTAQAASPPTPAAKGVAKVEIVDSPAANNGFYMVRFSGSSRSNWPSAPCDVSRFLPARLWRSLQTEARPHRGAQHLGRSV